MEPRRPLVLSSWISQLVDRLLGRPTPVPARVVIRPDASRLERR